jgi:TPP-dependent trihydroxycyclohexane-1,2-dione (THcHDO) dehydratase
LTWAGESRTGRLGELEVIGLVNKAVGGRATVVRAAGAMPGELPRLWRPEEPKTYHLQYGFSCMGYEIAGDSRKMRPVNDPHYDCVGKQWEGDPIQVPVLA